MCVCVGQVIEFCKEMEIAMWYQPNTKPIIRGVLLPIYGNIRDGL